MQSMTFDQFSLKQLKADALCVHHAGAKCIACRTDSVCHMCLELANKKALVEELKSEPDNVSGD